MASVTVVILTPSAPIPHLPALITGLLTQGHRFSPTLPAPFRCSCSVLAATVGKLWLRSNLYCLLRRAEGEEREEDKWA